MAFMYREVQIEDDKTLADTGTLTVDLNVKDPITELVLRYYVANESGAHHDANPELTISKIELVDGGRSIWSAYGETAVAAACFDTGKWPNVDYCEIGGYGQYSHIPIRFGRYLGDEKYNFDATRLKNPQLKFTWVDSAEFLADYTKLGVTAKVMAGATGSMEALMWQEIETFTSAAEGVKRIEMPVDRIYRRMFIRAYIEGSLPQSVISHLKLDIGLGDFVPFDLDFGEFEDLCQQHFGPYDFRALVAFDNTGDRECWMAGGTHVSAEPSQSRHCVVAFASGNPCYNVYVWKTDDDSTPTDHTGSVIVRGNYPHCCMPYQFGRPDDPETWFDSRPRDRVDLYLTQGTISAECTVAVQSPVTL